MCPANSMKTFLALLTVVLTMPMSLCAAAADAPTGASLAWTSDEPAVVRAREFIFKGELANAEGELAAAGDGVAVAETREIIRRIRRDYPHAPEKMFALLGPKIRDLQPDDLEGWRRAGQLQFRIIDGQVAYFRREPSNLFRFCPDAIARRISPPPVKRETVLLDHLARVIAEAHQSPGQAQVLPVRHEIHFTLTVPANAAGAKPGSVVRAWLPYPQEYRQQTDVELLSAAPGKPVIAENGRPHRSLYFEHRIDDPAKPITFEASYAYTSHAYYPVLNDAKVEALPADFPAEFLAERKPHLLFSPKLRETVANVVGAETNPLAKARKIFHWIDANLRYHAEEEYSIIPSFSEHAMSRRRGDCGIQASLFITMCRAAGVPARWQSGWQTIPGGHNMHDWAEIYVAPWGWLPCDPSYGLKPSKDPAVREFYFGHQDAFRMIVNLDYGRAFEPAKTSLRSEPADFQCGEVEIDGRNLFFDQFDYEFEIRQIAPAPGGTGKR
jgi:transglutaminase-like putative cysteine protease